MGCPTYICPDAMPYMVSDYIGIVEHFPRTKKSGCIISH
nr:MAG TPA: hypothetical protein [Caudoviricetes sp.]